MEGEDYLRLTALPPVHAHRPQRHGVALCVRSKTRTLVFPAVSRCQLPSQALSATRGRPWVWARLWPSRKCRGRGHDGDDVGGYRAW